MRNPMRLLYYLHKHCDRKTRNQLKWCSRLAKDFTMSVMGRKTVGPHDTATTCVCHWTRRHHVKSLTSVQS